MKEARNEGVFTPLSVTASQISMPGELGGSNWGGAAGDPETGMLYVRSADQPGFHAPMIVERIGGPVAPRPERGEARRTRVPVGDAIGGRRVLEIEVRRRARRRINGV